MLPVQIVIASPRKPSTPFDTTPIFVSNISDQKPASLFPRNLISKYVVCADYISAIPDILCACAKDFPYFTYFEPGKICIDSVVLIRIYNSCADLNYFCGGTRFIAINKRDWILFFYIKFSPVESERSRGNFWPVRRIKLITGDIGQNDGESSNKNGCNGGYNAVVFTDRMTDAEEEDWERGRNFIAWSAIIFVLVVIWALNK